MQQIGAANFNEQCLALLDNLSAEGLMITKHGKPAARVIPYSQRSEHVIGALRDKISICGDVMSTGAGWDG